MPFFIIRQYQILIRCRKIKSNEFYTYCKFVFINRLQYTKIHDFDFFTGPLKNSPYLNFPRDCQTV
jgi:hypothetical protein